MQLSEHGFVEQAGMMWLKVHGSCFTSMLNAWLLVTCLWACSFILYWHCPWKNILYYSFCTKFANYIRWCQFAVPENRFNMRNIQVLHPAFHQVSSWNYNQTSAYSLQVNVAVNVIISFMSAWMLVSCGARVLILLNPGLLVGEKKNLCPEKERLSFSCCLIL